MVKLTDLGFTEGVIAETVVSTCNEDGKPNAAPMGTFIEGKQLAINIFNSTLTFSNIKTSMCAVINLTNDIEIFYKTAIKEINKNGKLPRKWFRPAKTVKAPKLTLAEATIEVEVAEICPITTEKTKVIFKVKLVDAPKKYPQAQPRAMAATVEAIIYATRIKLFINEKTQQSKINDLSKMVDNCEEIIKHTAPDSNYSLILTDLKKRIHSWRSMT